MGKRRGPMLIATQNPGKLSEFRRLMAAAPFELVSLDDAGVQVEVEESGKTFAENATLKAAAYAEVSGMPTLADDSGLEVDALGGAPGVRSARYGGPGLGDADRVAYLLEQMRDVPGWRRAARFRAVLALAGGPVSGAPLLVEGVCEGAIAHESIGRNGFGYDPVFWIPRLAKTTAELTGEQKDAISHRGIAARRALELLHGLAS